MKRLCVNIKRGNFVNSVLPAIIILVLFVPSPAYAYLDPGTGNILIYLAASLVGALAFSFRNVFWKIFGKKSGDDSKLDYGAVAIFSEGAIYWNTFEPVANALIEINQPFSYYTMDIRDPGLTISNRFMRSKYIGDGASAFAKMGTLRSKVLLATTPNIGTPGFPMPRPKHAGCLAHVFHGVADLSVYKKGSLDHYDAAFIIGDFMIHGIRHLERLRGLKEKELVPAGLPYLDNLASKIKRPLPPTDGNTILIAPSWGTKSCLRVYGSGFVKELAAAGFKIILRPHPHSWKVDKDLLEQLREELSGINNIEWDKGSDGADARERSDLMISDKSTIRMDYVMLYERPVITLKIKLADPETFESCDMDEIWIEKAEREIGAVVDENRIADIVQIVRETLANAEKRDFSAFRDANIYNFGSSGMVIAKYLAGFTVKSSDGKE
jgi:hypothetical protein